MEKCENGLVTVKQEPVDNLQDYAKTTVKELFGWYGYANREDDDIVKLLLTQPYFSQPASDAVYSTQSAQRETKNASSEKAYKKIKLSNGRPIKVTSITTNRNVSMAEVATQDVTVSSIGSVAISNDEHVSSEMELRECTWCRSKDTNSPMMHCQSDSRYYCSDICFSKCRRATFKKGKLTCDWCRQRQHYLEASNVHRQVDQLRFCSDNCRTQYKINIFCAETKLHLSQPRSIFTGEKEIAVLRAQVAPLSMSEHAVKNSPADISLFPVLSESSDETIITPYSWLHTDNQLSNLRKMADEKMKTSAETRNADRLPEDNELSKPPTSDPYVYGSRGSPRELSPSHRKRKSNDALRGTHITSYVNGGTTNGPDQGQVALNMASETGCHHAIGSPCCNIEPVRKATKHAANQAEPGSRRRSPLLSTDKREKKKLFRHDQKAAANITKSPGISQFHLLTPHPSNRQSFTDTVSTKNLQSFNSTSLKSEFEVNTRPDDDMLTCTPKKSSRYNSLHTSTKREQLPIAVSGGQKTSTDVESIIETKQEEAQECLCAICCQQENCGQVTSKVSDKANLDAILCPPEVQVCLAPVCSPGLQSYQDVTTGIISEEHSPSIHNQSQKQDPHQHQQNDIPTFGGGNEINANRPEAKSSIITCPPLARTMPIPIILPIPIPIPMSPEKLRNFFVHQKAISNEELPQPFVERCALKVTSDPIRNYDIENKLCNSFMAELNQTSDMNIKSRLHCSNCRNQKHHSNSRYIYEHSKWEKVTPNSGPIGSSSHNVDSSMANRDMKVPRQNRILDVCGHGISTRRRLAPYDSISALRHTRQSLDSTTPLEKEAVRLSGNHSNNNKLIPILQSNPIHQPSGRSQFMLSRSIWPKTVYPFSTSTLHVHPASPDNDDKALDLSTPRSLYDSGYSRREDNSLTPTLNTASESAKFDNNDVPQGRNSSRTGMEYHKTGSRGKKSDERIYRGRPNIDDCSQTANIIQKIHIVDSNKDPPLAQQLPLAPADRPYSTRRCLILDAPSVANSPSADKGHHAGGVLNGVIDVVTRR